VFAPHTSHFLLLRVPVDYLVRNGGTAELDLLANTVYGLPVLLNYLLSWVAVHSTRRHLNQSRSEETTGQNRSSQSEYWLLLLCH